MCEANVYMHKGDQDELVMEAVDVVESLDPARWRLVSIFGEQKIIRARIKQLALGNHRVYFQPAD